MSNARRPILAIASVGVMIAGAGCGRNQVVEAPEPVAATYSAPATSPAASAAPKAASEAPRSNATDDMHRAALEERIYFGLDRAELSSQARSTLSSKSDVLRGTPAITLRIEGHADEQGSDEYNLALSHRRAAETKRFLVQQGIDASRLEITAYGEERPLASGHDEQAWSMNRRAEFQVTGGAGSR